MSRDTKTVTQYEAIHDTAALVDGLPRRIIRVWGDRARETLGGLVTNHVEALPPGRALYVFMLTPKGRPVAEGRVLALEEGDLWFDVPHACFHQALEHLKRYLPPRLARHGKLEGWTRLSLVGPESPRLLRRTSGDGGGPDPLEIRPLVIRPLVIRAPGAEPDGPPTETGVGESLAQGFFVRREEVEGPGFDLYVPADRRERLEEAVVRELASVGGARLEPGVYDIWRVERGIPVYGREIDLDVLPQETGQVGRAVNFEKGCYTGQEVVARIHYRGKVNRHLRGVRFPEEIEALPESGHELFAGERARATVTSAVVSPRLGPVALAYVRREVSPGDRLALEPGGEPGCRVVELPFL